MSCTTQRPACRLLCCLGCSESWGPGRAGQRLRSGNAGLKLGAATVLSLGVRWSTWGTGCKH
jgi:hypothetical protein